MAGKRKAFMDQVLSQVARSVEGVRQEGGVRRFALEFPDNPVTIVIIRRGEYESVGAPENTKAPHRYIEQMMVEPRCGWCGQKEHSILHAGF